MKAKKCKVCKTSFEPAKPLQQVCSPVCAIELSNQVKAKSEKKERLKVKKELKEKVKSTADYRKDLQVIINKIIRTIDEGHNCISSGRKYKSNDQAGHYYSVGAYPHLRFNLHNIYSQSVADNLYKSGNPIGFTQGLIRDFGEDWLKIVTKLPEEYRELKLDKEQIKEAIIKAKDFLSRINDYKETEVFLPSQRIFLRHLGNKEIGIYNE